MRIGALSCWLFGHKFDYHEITAFGHVDLRSDKCIRCDKPSEAKNENKG